MPRQSRRRNQLEATWRLGLRVLLVLGFTLSVGVALRRLRQPRGKLLELLKRVEDLHPDAEGKGDSAAWQELIDRYEGRLLAFVNSRLRNRAASEEVFQQVVQMINDFKDYFIRHDQPVSENPSPGTKAGGLTTLEEKSLGAIQKGGQATVQRVLRYGERAGTGGLSLLEAPGNDGVSSTAMVASGAVILLFTSIIDTDRSSDVPSSFHISMNSASGSVCSTVELSIRVVSIGGSANKR